MQFVFVFIDHSGIVTSQPAELRAPSADDDLPTGQPMQLLLEAEPAPPKYLPNGHESHATALALDWYLPALQLMHCWPVAPMPPYFPGVHFEGATTMRKTGHRLLQELLLTNPLLQRKKFSFEERIPGHEPADAAFSALHAKAAWLMVAYVSLRADVAGRLAQL